MTTRKGSLLALALLLMVPGLSASSGEILLQDSLASITEGWQVWDNPHAKEAPSIWSAGLTELTGTSNKPNKIATALIAGDAAWRDYSVETSLVTAGSGGRGNLSVLLFGYQGPEHFYHIAYDFKYKRFDLELRTATGFEKIAHCHVRLPGREKIPLRLDFAAGRIRFVAGDLVVFDLQDGRYTQGRIGIGASGLRSAHTLIGPVSVTAVDPAALPPRQLQDLLAEACGATLVAENNSYFPAAIDHVISIGDVDQPYRRQFQQYFSEQKEGEAVFALPGNLSGELHRMELRGLWTHAAAEIQILVSAEAADSGFVPVGGFQLEAGAADDKTLIIEPTIAKYVKLKISTTAERGQLGIDEFLVYGYRVETAVEPADVGADLPAVAPGTVLLHDDFNEGLDQWTQWDDAEANGRGAWAAAVSEFSGIRGPLDKSSTMLLAGDNSWTNYALQAEVFARTGKGWLNALVFGHRSSDQFYHVGYNHARDRYELEVKKPGGLRMLAIAETKYPIGRWVPMRLDFVAGRILFRVDGQIIFDVDDESYAGGKIGIEVNGLAEPEILMRNLRVTPMTPEALPRRELADLLAAARGAAVIYREAVPEGGRFNALIDHRLTEANTLSTYRVNLASLDRPEAAVFAFPQGRMVEIHSIGIDLADRDPPKELGFWVSVQTPKSGFEPLRTIVLDPGQDGYDEFELAPTKAKYLKVQITSGHGDTVRIEEIRVKGVFGDLDPTPDEAGAIGQVQVREAESNDTYAQANTVPTDVYVGGEVRDGDVDYFRLSLSSPGNLLTVELNHVGPVAPKAELLDDSGNVLTPDHRVRIGRVTRLTFSLVPEDYLLRLTRPPTYLTIVYDDSGSMGESVPTVKRVLKGYLTNLGRGLQLKLMKYTGEVSHLSDFTADPAALAEAIDSEVGGTGGTQTFMGLMTAIKSVQEKDGNRGVLAILDHFDGEQSVEQYLQLWDDVLGAVISFSTIGVREGWDYDKPFLGNFREQIFRELAYSTQGQFFHSPTDEQVERSAEVLFEQLTGPAKYRFRATWEQEVKLPGTLRVEFAEGAEERLTRNAEIILDASNSMWGQVGGTSKIEIAREVLARVIGEWPQGTNLGLRVYGHRYGLKDERACEDTELVAPIEPVERERLIGQINSIRPKGKTPLVHSVLQVPADFEALGSGTIVLITDGIESCDGDISSIGPQLEQAGLQLKLHIVGFDIESEEARKELEAIAQSASGRYFDARDAGALLNSLVEAVRLEYVVLDEAGKQVARGFVDGDPVELLEGEYSLQLMVDPEPVRLQVSVPPAQLVRFVAQREGATWVLSSD